MRIRDILGRVTTTLLIGREVYRWATRERMMYGFLLLALLFILMANVPFMVNDPRIFGDTSPEAAALHIGFVSVHIFIPLIAVFVSVSVLQSFFGRPNLALFLSKPVRSWQMLAGAVTGLFEMVFLNWVLMTAGLWFILVSQTRQLTGFLWPGMSVALVMGLLCIGLTVFFYLLVPNALAGILTILMLVAGLGGPLARETFLRAAGGSFSGRLLAVSAGLLPQVNALWGVSMTTLHLFDLRLDTGRILAHTFGFIFVVLAASFFKFRSISRI
ncbi:MAG: hypothetical protein ACM3L6_00150 [Deltaproteobacteria bacterium]